MFAPRRRTGANHATFTPEVCIKSPSVCIPPLSDAVEVREPPFPRSLALSPRLARRLSHFQRDHGQYPPLLPFKCRTVYVPMMGADLRPSLSHDGKPIMARVLLEVAFQEYTRHPRWDRRPRALWFFVAWDIDGSCLQKVRRRSRAGALKWYKRPASALRVVRTEKRYVLVTAPKAASLH